MVRHGGSSAGSYLANPTSPIPYHCASIVVTSTVRVNIEQVKGKSWCGDREDCQHAVIDGFLCTVTGCTLGTDVCHWMYFFSFKVTMVQGQQDSPLNQISPDNNASFHIQYNSSFENESNLFFPGQKTCLHLHGVFPYLYVPYDGPGMDAEPGTRERYLRQFAASVDKALNVALGRSTSHTQHVYRVILVKAV